ncbi:MAG TPA: DUF3667 domain-containing protein, partial [Rhizobiaceae bacterium]|nr:DUF3667 domain-containing protein [Rhizobiaceae bacterium]
MGELGEIGEVVSGAVFARAIEPDTGAVASDGHTHQAACLNCATPLAGEYCHACGQRGHVHRTLTAFFHDLLHSVVHFEGKVWKTLPRLAWRPGELTRDYVAGKRASFVSPMALFLFSVFLLYAVVSWMGGPSIGSPELSAGLATDAAKSEALAARLEGERTRAVAAGKATARIDKKIADARDEAR